MRVKLKHQKLARQLARSSMSLNRWALRMKLGSGHLSDLVNGKRPYPRPATREKLLRALDLAFDELFEIERPRNDLEEGIGPPKGPRLAKLTQRPLSSHPSPDRASPGERWMNQLIQDIRFAFRQMGRRPAFAALAILTLAIGIGANSALFSMVNAVLWKEYPYERPERIYRVYSSHPQNIRSSVSYPDYWDYLQNSPAFEALAAHDWEPYGLAGGEQPVRVGGGRVTWNLFQVLGLELLMGRAFTPEEDQPGGPNVVILSESLWKSYFGSDPDILKRRVILNSQPYAVIGIMPAEAEYPDSAKLWVPLGLDPAGPTRGSRWLQLTGRLKQSASEEEARAQLQAVAARLAEAYPDSNENRSATLESLRSRNVGPYRIVFLSLLGLVGFVLLIVCANVSNLLLARGLARQRELAIRSALGARRGAIFRQLSFESLILGLGGGVVGFALGSWGLSWMTGLIPVQLPSWLSFELDWRVVLYTLLISLAASMVSGIVPALQGTRFELTRSLRESGGHSNASLGRHRFRRFLVVAEVALSLVVLVGAGLVVRSVLKLSSVDTGFETENRLTVGMDMLSHLNESIPERIAAFERFQERLRAVPGVEALGAIDRLPLLGSDSTSSMATEGQTDDEYKATPPPLIARVNSSYFEAMGIPLLRGAVFPDRLTEGWRPVVVSAKAAELFWPSDNPLGRRLKFGPPSYGGDWYEVAGVVSDVKHTGIEDDTRATVYFPYQILPLSRMTWVVKSAPNAVSLTSAVRQAVSAVESGQPLHDILPLREVVNRSYWQWELFGMLFQVFAAVGLALACIGIYGVMSYSVSERTQELGVRLALGARSGQLLRFVLGQGAWLIVIGLAIGLPISIGVSYLLSAVLYQVGTFDLPTFLAVGAILVSTALAAIALPASRASRVDPIQALKYE